MIHCFSVAFKTPPEEALRLIHKLNCRRVATIVTMLTAFNLCAPHCLAVDSKWTIENKFTGIEVEAFASRDNFASNDEGFLQRLVAEGCLAEGENRQALDLLAASVKALAKNTRSNDLRLQSARIALSEAYLSVGDRKKALDVLRIALKNLLELDRMEEEKYRKRLSSNDLLEKDIESQTQFELRYENYFEQIKAAPLAVMAHQAQRLFWNRRILDSYRLAKIGAQLSDNPPHAGKLDATADSAQKKNFVFLQALSSFALEKRLALCESAKTLTNLLARDSQKDGAIDWNARLTFLSGLICELDQKRSEAEKLFGTAIDTAKKSDDRYSTLLFRVYLGNSLMASGDPVSAYQELNHTFEDSRRLIEGRKEGLDYIGIAKAGLDGMYKSLLIRMNYAEDLESKVSASEIDSLNNACSLDPGASLQQCTPNVHPYKEDYQKLADALYHVGYQSKITGNQSRARQFFWYSARIYEKHLPENRRQLGIVLYDLAESFAWSDAPDIAVIIFERCAELRKEIDPYSNDYIMTLNTLGRTYMANREPQKATVVLRTALALYTQSQEMQAQRISRLVKQLKTRNKFDSISATANTNNNSGLDLCSLDSQLSAAAACRTKADSAVRSQIEDLWQVIADSYSRGKNYDEAKHASRWLLKLRQDSGDASRDELLGSLWQFAYICGMSNSHEDSKKSYGEMISKYAKGPGKPLADWYYNLGVVEDSLGHPESAAHDFKRAISEYRTHLKTLDKIDDAEDIQHIGWLISDLKLELKAKSKCPPDSPDYFHSYPHYNWGADRFPLKIYIDDTEERGFGPKLYAYMKKAVDEWSDTPGLKERFVFVDDREKADIYFERVSTYDLIPFGSGGGATASFVNNDKKSKKEIDRVHLRLYCRERDLDKLSNHAVDQLYTLALHEFGHGLGLGHSPSGGDVMYWKSAMYKLSSRDRSTLLKIYGFQEGKPD